MSKRRLHKNCLDAEETIKRSSLEVESWSEWKLKNTLLAFSEYQRKKNIRGVTMLDNGGGLGYNNKKGGDNG